MISENISLKPYNTFGIDVKAKKFAPFQSVAELEDLLDSNKSENIFILGGGSNILFTKNVSSLVLKNEIKGIEILYQDEENITLRVGAGEVWHEFVLYCVANEFAGVENLSLIPGNVGASPMQNIGAYGVEVKDVIQHVEAYHLESKTRKIFSNGECKFGYRESVFKREFKDQYVITHVVFKLSLNPNINTSYGAIENELKTKGISKASLKDVSDAVISIRQSKLPDPKVIGNAGSFFKNPVVKEEIYQKIKSNYPDAPSYPVLPGEVKIPAAWLIEQAGWKGKTFETFGVHKNQALVLVNYGGSSGQQIWDLSTQIKEDVFSKFGVDLEREVNVL